MWPTVYTIISVVVCSSHDFYSIFSLLYILLHTHEYLKGLLELADEQSVELLKAFQADNEPIVAQSCEVALCMLDLERQGKSFEVGFCRHHCASYVNYYCIM
jgi:hypothetical protein